MTERSSRAAGKRLRQAMDKGMEAHLEEMVEERIEAKHGADSEQVAAAKEAAGLKEAEGKTKTTVTVELEFDGFVGVGQAQAGAAAMLSNVKNAATFDGARIVNVEAAFSQGGKTYKGLASGADLAKQTRAEREAAPGMFGNEPAPAISGHTVAPLGVEEERGGLESGNIDELGGKVGAYGVGDKVKPAKGAGDTVTSPGSKPKADPPKPAPKATTPEPKK